MYTTCGTGFEEFSQAHHIGTRKYRHKPGHREQKEKKTPSRRKPHGFLNTKIPSIASDLYVENDRDVAVNVTTKGNLDFLCCSVMKYVQLLDVELPYHPTGRASIREEIYLPYNALDSIVSYHVNLKLVGDRLQFCIYHFHEWPDYTLFPIPIDFTERLRGEIKRITLEFIGRLIECHGIMGITDTSYFEMSEVCTDCVGFEQLDEEEEKDLYRKEKLFRSYEKGRVHGELYRMYSRASCKNLEVHIRNYNPPDNKEKGLLELITEGMSPIVKDSPRILNYDYDYAGERERDFEPPPLEYQILLTYFIMDAATKDMESCFSTDCQEAYNQTPISFTFITPETEKLFRPENYPERFLKWFKKFIEHVTYSL